MGKILHPQEKKNLKKQSQRIKGGQNARQGQRPTYGAHTGKWMNSTSLASGKAYLKGRQPSLLPAASPPPSLLLVSILLEEGGEEIKRLELGSDLD